MAKKKGEIAEVQPEVVEPPAPNLLIAGEKAYDLDAFDNIKIWETAKDGRSFLFCALCKGNNPDAFLPVSSIHEARAYETFAVDYWKSKGRM